MFAIENEIRKVGLIPVVVLNSVSETEPVLRALTTGGVPVAEICYRTACAPECLKTAVKEFPNMLIGAGTVINAEQCLEAIRYGAKFIVSPGLSDAVAAVCQKEGIPYLPGVVTPTEIMHALELGLTTLKFFPAGVYGGLKAIKALSAAFPQCCFMPTGGVDNSNLKEFISFDKILACGGSWMVKGSQAQIIQTCQEARSIITEIRG
ncbi:MAG: bifunctional 4-hydroxy-2-oxoglutarate aldolase/2-dehydro-3-deoxy-phosphogluconate aldolase [Clostridia bacterium]|nr:bifunctional 4-hydroxy-2-oxoglutarate aldolase/2-dehydro-3-deoxy-phosphogluconate aldolase [Clostridia bacterium]